VSELLTSPLLVARRARSSGGAGGRRLRVAAAGDGGYELVVEDHGRAPSARRYADAAAVVHAFNAELRRAARAGLTSRPEPAALSVAALRAAERASGGR
jgi:hypothetical protein